MVIYTLSLESLDQCLTLHQGFSNFFHGDPNNSIKILHDLKTEKQKLKGGGLVELQSLSTFEVILIHAVQNLFILFVYNGKSVYFVYIYIFWAGHRKARDPNLKPSVPSLGPDP